MNAAARTLVDKIWDDHLVGRRDDGRDLLYVDRVVMDDVRAPDAIRLLEASGRPLRRPDLAFATIDHTVGTHPGRDADLSPAVAAMVEAVRAGARRHAFRFFDLNSPEQGISHVVAPEIGLVLPGATHVCSDSHAATVGALGALAFGCSSTDLAHVLATQTIALERPQTMRVRLNGALQPGVDAKDVVLWLIGQLGIHGARGYAIEYTGAVAGALPMEQRFTLCNMAIEMGARTALIAPDATTIAWLAARPWRLAEALRESAQAYWETLRSDDGAEFDRSIDVVCDGIEPQITWGTTRAWSFRSPAEFPIPRRRIPRAGSRSNARWRIWTSFRATRSRAGRCSASSSVRARMRGWTICVRPRCRCAARASRPACARSLCRVRRR